MFKSHTVYIHLDKIDRIVALVDNVKLVVARNRCEFERFDYGAYL